MHKAWFWVGGYIVLGLFLSPSGSGIQGTLTWPLYLLPAPKPA